MCGISASFDVDILITLMTLNNKRGRHSFSLMVYDVSNKSIFALHQGFDDCREVLAKYYKQLNRHFYYISHSQAPTSTDIGSEYDFSRIHPANIDDSYLYHNGIIKDDSIDKLRIMVNSNSYWDTMLLLQGLVHYDECSYILNFIKGSYACILVSKATIFTFRNDSSILYYDDDLNISSINYSSTMTELPSNMMFLLDLDFLVLVETSDFNSPDEGYHFA
jgi:hypothetical protein